MIALNMRLLEQSRVSGPRKTSSRALPPEEVKQPKEPKELKELRTSAPVMLIPSKRRLTRSQLRDEPPSKPPPNPAAAAAAASESSVVSGTPVVALAQSTGGSGGGAGGGGLDYHQMQEDHMKTLEREHKYQQNRKLREQKGKGYASSDSEMGKKN